MTIHKRARPIDLNEIDVIQTISQDRDARRHWDGGKRDRGRDAAEKTGGVEAKQSERGRVLHEQRAEVEVGGRARIAHTEVEHKQPGNLIRNGGAVI